MMIGRRHPEVSYQLLWLLLLGDLIFIALYALYGFDVVHDPKFGIIEDWSYGEVFQYIKELWIAALLACMAVRHRSLLCVAWGVLFLYLLADDAAQLHERLGRIISTKAEYQPRFGLRGQDFGELTVVAIAGVTLLSAIGVTHLRANDAEKRLSRALAALLALLVFFGVAIDMVPHVEEPWFIAKGVGVVEDGGEMVAMSIITWLVFDQTLRRVLDRTEDAS